LGQWHNSINIHHDINGKSEQEPIDELVGHSIHIQVIINPKHDNWMEIVEFTKSSKKCPLYKFYLKPNPCLGEIFFLNYNLYHSIYHGCQCHWLHSF